MLYAPTKEVADVFERAYGFSYTSSTSPQHAKKQEYSKLAFKKNHSIPGADDKKKRYSMTTCFMKRKVAVLCSGQGQESPMLR